MIRLTRPYASHELAEGDAYGPADSFIAISQTTGDVPPNASRLLTSGSGQARRSLMLLPYPTTDTDTDPPVSGMPTKPKPGSEIRSDADRFAHDTLARMHQVLARVQELEEALDDPEHLWPRLRKAWDTAAEEANPRMAEIVRQARDMGNTLEDLERRLRKVLRRDHARVALDRVNEMDRRSMQWLARQPGRTVAERAGGDQRILAIVRNENYDTLENRVLHAYVRLADAVAREWLEEHRGLAAGRYDLVRSYRRKCRAFADELSALGIGVAAPGVLPNYVLQDDRSYHGVFEAWVRLLRQSAQEDEIWAWQAETWTDFCILAVTLGIEALPDAELVAQSPIRWRSETHAGRWFEQDNPLAVFWLREVGLVAEIQARPKVSTRQFETKAIVWLRLTDLKSGDQRRIPIWTPHMMQRQNPDNEAQAACKVLDQVRRVPEQDLYEMYDGLVLLPAHGNPETASKRLGERSVLVVLLDASGFGLALGMDAIGAFVRQNLMAGMH